MIVYFVLPFLTSSTQNDQVLDYLPSLLLSDLIQGLREGFSRTYDWLILAMEQLEEIVRPEATGKEKLKLAILKQFDIFIVHCWPRHLRSHTEHHGVVNLILFLLDARYKYERVILDTFGRA